MLGFQVHVRSDFHSGMYPKFPARRCTREYQHDAPCEGHRPPAIPAVQRQKVYRALHVLAELNGVCSEGFVEAPSPGSR